MCSPASGAVESVFEAPGFAAGVDDVGSVGEAVDDGFGESRVGEDFRPFAEGEVGRDDQAAAFVAFREDLEDELGLPAFGRFHHASSLGGRTRLRRHVLVVGRAALEERWSFGTRLDTSCGTYTGVV